VAELLGTHSYQLDPKGRVSLPARFREAFADGLWLTIGQDGCLFCFPRVEWERRSDEVASSPLSDADGRAYARLFFGSSDEAKVDGQGRVTIPQRLRELVGINKDEARKRWGSEQVHLWQRSYDIAPPGGESLRDTALRVLPFYEKWIVPELQKGKSVIVVAHGHPLTVRLLKEYVPRWEARGLRLVPVSQLAR